MKKVVQRFRNTQIAFNAGLSILIAIGLFIVYTIYDWKGASA